MVLDDLRVLKLVQVVLKLWKVRSSRVKEHAIKVQVICRALHDVVLVDERLHGVKVKVHELGIAQVEYGIAVDMAPDDDVAGEVGR